MDCLNQLFIDFKIISDYHKSESKQIVTVNYFEGNLLNIQYSFDAVIKVNIYDDLLINFSEIAEMLN